VRRREFVALLGAAAAWPLAARAQQAGKLPTVGYLGSGTPATQGQLVAVFVQRLRELGWIEGRTIAIEYRWAHGRFERFAEIAAEFVRLKVDVILTSGPPVFAAKQATSAIPIVFATVADPLSTGLVASLARPGGNVTGLSLTSPEASNSCAKSSPASADWRSWPMPTIRRPCGSWTRWRSRPTRSASRPSR
jgi:putative ABC transport system substrate-binding protein